MGTMSVPLQRRVSSGLRCRTARYRRQVIRAGRRCGAKGIAKTAMDFT